MPHLLQLPTLLFLLLVLTADGFNWTNSSIPGCSIVDCGDGTTISYPFWIPDQNSTAFCGYPEFKVTCNYTSPSFRTLSDNYTVRSIDKGNRTLFLTDSDVIGNNCPKARHNVSLGTNSPLSLGDSNSYLIFFFHCDLNLYTGPRPIPEGNVASCLQNVSGISYVFDKEYLKEYGSLSRACDNTTVVSPVLKGPLLNDGNLAASFGRAMNGGFQLVWKKPEMEDCKGCEESGGYCGYDNRTGGGLVFQCFCKDGIHYRSDCNGSDKKSKKTLKIGIAIGGVFFGLALALGAFLFWRHMKKKERAPSLSSLFRSISSHASSISKDPESLPGSYYKTPIFSYKELEEATDGFDSSNELGDGGFGVVFKGKLKDGRIVAVKRLYERNHRRVKQFRNEVEILNRLRHRNLVTLYGCTSAHESNDLVLVYEYIPNGTVADHLHGSLAAEHALTWHIRMSIAIETADALSYLHVHQPQIIHRDVKTSNILLDNNYTVKVADFGLSRLFPVDVTHVSTAPQGTPGYVDPEYHQCYQLTDKSDVYSFGVVLVELISSKAAVDISRHRSEINLSNMAMDKIPKGLVGELVDPMLGFDEDPVVRRMVQQVADVAFKCLQPARDERPSMDEVREMLKDIACMDEGRPPVDEKHMRDDARLLKFTHPNSPKSVADNWVSRSTTPNASA